MAVIQHLFLTGLTGFNRIANCPAEQILQNPVNPVRRTQFIRTLLSYWRQLPNQKPIRKKSAAIRSGKNFKMAFFTQIDKDERLSEDKHVVWKC